MIYEFQELVWMVLVFFFIGKKEILLLEEKKRYKEFTVVNKEPQWQKEIKESTSYSKRQKKISNSRKIWKTQHRDQSKRIYWHKSNNWAINFSKSSKERRLRSVQIVHIKQPSTKFQISELYFPSQWCQQQSKSTTKPGMTQSIPNSWIICIHIKWANGQKIRSWSTDSSLQQHIQQQFAKGRPRSIRLSKMRI